jgi:hypothetical protein
VHVSFELVTALLAATRKYPALQLNTVRVVARTRRPPALLHVSPRLLLLAIVHAANEAKHALSHESVRKMAGRRAPRIAYVCTACWSLFRTAGR